MRPGRDATRGPALDFHSVRRPAAIAIPSGEHGPSSSRIVQEPSSTTEATVRPLLSLARPRWLNAVGATLLSPYAVRRRRTEGRAIPLWVRSRPQPPRPFTSVVSTYDPPHPQARKGKKQHEGNAEPQFRRSTARSSDARKHHNKYGPNALGDERRARKWQNRPTGTLVDISFALGALNDVEKSSIRAAQPQRPVARQHFGGPAFRTCCHGIRAPASENKE